MGQKYFRSSKSIVKTLREIEEELRPGDLQLLLFEQGGHLARLEQDGVAVHFGSAYNQPGHRIKWIVLDHCKPTAGAQDTDYFSSLRTAFAHPNMVKYANRGYEVEGTVRERNPAGIFLQAGCNAAGLETAAPHHGCRYIAPAYLSEVVSHQTCQLSLAAAEIQVRELRCIDLPSLEVIPDQIALAEVEKERVCAFEAISDGISQ